VKEIEEKFEESLKDIKDYLKGEYDPFKSL